MPEKGFRRLDRLRLRRIEHGQPIGVMDAEGMKEQDHFGEIRPLDFGGGELGAVELAAFGPQPQADPRCIGVRYLSDLHAEEGELVEIGIHRYSWR